MAYSSIVKPSDYFNTKLYTGNATNPTTISGIGFQPDWVWTKARSAAEGHRLCDAVRGATKDLLSNTTAAESTNAIGLLSFNSDGYVIGNSNGYNQNSQTFVSWNWLANGAGSANNDGNVESTVSVNSTAGFSIVKWSGTTNNKTIGHGLGTVPAMVIAKNTGGSGTNWIVYHKNLTSGYFLKLNLTNAQDNANSYFTADPTNSILSLTGNTAFNSSGNNMIAYCFAEKTGYSKFGSYTGNGSTDGTFVYTGFKPAWVLVKCTSAQADWELSDNKRTTSGGNVIDKEVRPNTDGAETGGTDGRYIDYVSNGFKLRQGFGNWNASGATYIYMAFAEEPLVGDNPATAR